MDHGADDFDAALEKLKNGGVVAYPTETCYGLGVDATNLDAIEKLRALKGREGHRPISILIAEPSWLDALSLEVSDEERMLIDRFWPGPLTLLLRPRKDNPLMHLAAPLIGLRCSSHPLATELVRDFGKPITSTSANIAGSNAPRSSEEVRKHFSSERLLVLEDERKTTASSESTVVALDGRRTRIVREGAIAIKEIWKLLGQSE